MRILIIFCAFCLYWRVFCQVAPSGCAMDGCNPQRTNLIDGIAFPFTNTSQPLRLIWSFTNQSKNMQQEDKTLSFSSCSTDANILACLLPSSGVVILSLSTGKKLWEYSPAKVHLSQLRSVPLIWSNSAVVANIGDRIQAYYNDSLIWSNNLLTDLRQPLDMFSIGMVESDYFSVVLGDLRFAVYDLTLGWCWSAVPLINHNVSYQPVGVMSSFSNRMYVTGWHNSSSSSSNAVLFSLVTGGISDRISVQWTMPLKSFALDLNYGSTVFTDPETNSLVIFVFGTSTKDDQMKVLRGITDCMNNCNPSKFHHRILFGYPIGRVVCPFGIVVDPRKNGIDSTFRSIWIATEEVVAADSNQNVMLVRLDAMSGQVQQKIDVAKIMNEVNSNVSVETRGVGGIMLDGMAILVGCFRVVNESSSRSMVVGLRLDGKSVTMPWFIDLSNYGSDSRCSSAVLSGRTSDERPAVVVTLASGDVYSFAL